MHPCARLRICSEASTQDGAFGGAGYDVQTAGYAGYDLGQASQGPGAYVL